MRILYVTSFSDPTFIGGAERTLRTLVEGMAGRGHDVRVLSLLPSRPSGEVPAHTRRRPVHNLYPPDGAAAHGAARKLLWHGRDIWNRAAAGEVGGEIAAFRPDVLSCHNLAGWSASAWGAAWRAGVPVLQVLHDHYLMCVAGSRSRGGRPCLSRCARCRVFRLPHRHLSARIGGVVGISDHMLRTFRDAGYFRGVPGRRIYNAEPPFGIDLCAARPAGPPVFGYIGTLAAHKGVEHLVDAFAGARLPEGARLRIAGGGEPEYVAALKARRPDARITFEGRVRAADFLTGLTWCVVPSLSDEPLGRVVFESLGLGVPVIASRRGGIPEMVQDGVTGHLVPAGDTAALRRSLERAAVEPPEASRQQIAATVARFFDTGRFVDDYERFYAEVAGG